MTLVSSANIMGSVKVLIVGGRSFMYSMKGRALELTLGEFHVLFLTNLIKMQIVFW
jgi:hypothetical protein